MSDNVTSGNSTRLEDTRAYQAGFRQGRDMRRRGHHAPPVLLTDDSAYGLGFQAGYLGVDLPPGEQAVA